MAQGEQGLSQSQDLNFISEKEFVEDYSKKECHVALGRLFINSNRRLFINSNSLKVTLSKNQQPDDNRNMREKYLIQETAGRYTAKELGN